MSTRGWIVVFRAGTDPDAVTDALAAEHGFAPKHVFRHALLGFAAEMGEDAIAAVSRHPDVHYVEEDGPVRLA